jgi:hypothetical protein
VDPRTRRALTVAVLLGVFAVVVVASVLRG